MVVSLWRVRGGVETGRFWREGLWCLAGAEVVSIKTEGFLKKKRKGILYYVKNQQDATLAVLFISNCKNTLVTLQLLINNTAKVASCWFVI
jgi:hypothetical protein